MNQKEVKEVKVPQVAKKEVKEQNSVMALMVKSIEQGLDVTTLERLMSLKEKIDNEYKMQELTKALAEFQSKMPKIQKNKKVFNRDGTVRYSYASLDEIVEACKKNLAEAGLAYTIIVEQPETHVKAICKIKHIAGGEYESSFTIPIYKTEYMNAPQMVASALTYAKRYAFCNALGIMTADEDTDANDETGNETKENKDSLEMAVILDMIQSAQTLADIEAIKAEARTKRWTKEEVEKLKKAFMRKEAEFND